MPIDRAFEPDSGARPRSRSLDAVTAQLAARQHGVVARRQLLELGFGRRAIGHRVQRGRLHVVHRGVCAVGHRSLTQRSHWMAAVLAAGRDAVLSHHSAAALYGIRPTSRTRIDVTVPRALHKTSYLTPHRAVLAPGETTTHDGIPTTTPARTLHDLAATLNYRQLERAFTEAERLGLTSPTTIGRGHRGATNLRTLLLKARSPTRSELEAEFLTFLDTFDLPNPRTNTRIEGIEVDAAWHDQKLIVELDGYAFHHTRQAFEHDRHRDRTLTAKGWRVIRITANDLRTRPHELASQLRALLSMQPL
jgi:very-short-patch-repair endonuclease